MLSKLRVFPVALAILLLAALPVGHTAFAPQPSAPFSFVVMGDNRPGGAAAPQPEVFGRIVDEVNLLGPRFVLHGGDVISGSSTAALAEKQFSEFRKIADRLNCPMYIAVGNHEMAGRKQNEALYHKLFGRDPFYYSFTYGNCYFAALDTEIPGQVSKITGAQLEWLTKDLQKNSARAHKFVFMHRPLFPVSGHIGDSLDKYPEDRAKLLALLKKHNVDAVFSGHEHLYNKTTMDGVTEYISGGAGAPLYTSIFGTGAFNHYLWVTVDGKKVTVAVIRPRSIENPDFINASTGRKP